MIVFAKTQMKAGRFGMNTSTKINRLLAITVFCFSALHLSITNAWGEQGERLKARIILVIPQGAKPQKGYQDRLASVATRTEKFFADWMKHWDREIERAEFFERNPDGSVKVTLTKVKPKHGPNAQASLVEIRRLAIASAKQQLQIKKRTRVLWWIFYDYPGVKGFRGGGNSKYGSAINAYPAGAGLIDQNAHLASNKMSGTKIKGMIHEFGHALGLPHNGPRLELDLGNSLMGPIGQKFRKKTGSKDTRVYLNEASAALLWQHPIFKAGAPPKPVQPKRIKIDQLQAEESATGKIKISGILQSDLDAHSVVIFDSDSGKFKENYWSRSHVGTITNDGRFAVLFKSPHSQGKLFLSFCYNNGINTADGRRQTLQKSVIEIAYRGNHGKRTFQMPANK